MSRPGRSFPRWLMLATLAIALSGAAVAFHVLPLRSDLLPATGGTFALRAATSGMCVDVPAASLGNGTALQPGGCASASVGQQFKLVAAESHYLLENVGSGKCVDVPGGSTAWGTRLQLHTCAPSHQNQQWRLIADGTNTYQVINVNSGLCLSDRNAPGVAIVQETCTVKTNKQWTFAAVRSDGATE